MESADSDKPLEPIDHLDDLLGDGQYEAMVTYAESLPGGWERSFGQAIAKARLSRNDEALKDFEAAYKVDPVNTAVDFSSFLLDRPTTPRIRIRVKEMLRHALRNGESRAAVDLGYLLADEGNLKKAEKVYRSGISSWEARQNLARLYFKQERLEEALREFRYLVEVEDMPEFLNELGAVLVDLGRFDEAEGYFRSALEKGVSGTVCFLANLLWRTGRVEESEELFKTAWEQGETGVCFDYALMLEEATDRSDEAIEWYQRAKDKEAHQNLAMLYWRLARHAEAEAEFRVALSCDDPLAPKQYGLFTLELLRTQYPRIPRKLKKRLNTGAFRPTT